MCVEEKAATLTDALASLEAVVAVELDRETLDHLIWRYSIHHHDFHELFSLSEDNLDVDFHLKLSVRVPCFSYCLSFALVTDNLEFRVERLFATPLFFLVHTLDRQASFP